MPDQRPPGRLQQALRTELAGRGRTARRGPAGRRGWRRCRCGCDCDGRGCRGCGCSRYRRRSPRATRARVRGSRMLVPWLRLAPDRRRGDRLRRDRHRGRRRRGRRGGRLRALRRGACCTHPRRRRLLGAPASARPGEDEQGGGEQSGQPPYVAPADPGHQARSTVCSPPLHVRISRTGSGFAPLGR
jgi:hypothetical protein